MTGKDISEEGRKRLRRAHLGKTLSEKTKRKIGDANRGRHHSEETKIKMSNSMKGGNKTSFKKGHKTWIKGKHLSEETKRKIGNANRGRPCTEETRKKLSELGKGREKSEETRKRLSDSLRGRKLSKEHKKKILELNKLRKGKTYEELYGKEKANKLKENMSKKMKGHKVSERTKEIIRSKLIERGNPMKNEITRLKVSEKMKGKKPWNDGIEMRKETKEKLRKINLGKKHSKETIEKMRVIRRGDKSHFWKGGITKENLLLRQRSKYRIWRELVFMRDNYTCQNKDCSYCENKIGKILNAHHIKPFSIYKELRYNLENGITYCKEFHKKNRRELHPELYAQVIKR